MPAIVIDLASKNILQCVPPTMLAPSLWLAECDGHILSFNSCAGSVFLVSLYS
ncbi:hypothetical protein RO3G_09131 [Rhizopus delemar RA 99-880]|uniref:Uncharacterized protein n=1 Tax=Rhizopus delemar (strain RA 99-880 / ATCC MYA-4621 / FGSC 9543 / NRRL 43880) TaxID=246409 RepID=I1C7J1_RHIO9|nr:hypothetical protein RO3G_09131 [Rhizopus delemar RA 99-880]|eukprot:EIE84421.1 hypothetical protein RO3G_09131 [Rhizopus delemar RA 99-880]